MNYNTQNHFNLFIILSILFLLTSCQPTPSETFVISKSDKEFHQMLIDAGVQFDELTNELITISPEKAYEEIAYPIFSYNAPEKLEYSISNGNTTVNISADIIMPQYATPIYLLEPSYISYSSTNTFIDTIAPDKLLYNYDFVMSIVTKENIQVQIEELQQYIQWVNNNRQKFTDDDYEAAISYSQEIIHELYNQQSTAPDTLLQASESVIGQPLESGNGNYTKEMVTPIVLNEKNYNKTNYRLSADINGIRNIINIAASSNYRTQQLIFNDYSISYLDDAIFTISDAEKAIQPFLDTINDLTLQKTIQFETGKELIYKRIYSGVESNIAFSLPNAWVLPEHKEKYINGEKRQLEYFDKYYAQEALSVVFRNDGSIVNFAYESPLIVSGILTTNASLLPFDEIQDIFETHITLNGFTEDEFITVNIYEIRLGMMRIEIPNSDMFIAVPVWDFYGNFTIENWLHTNELGENNLDLSELQNCSFLTINALNGAVIDRSLGY